ncbi:MAG: CoA transferase, partial [Bacteroidetes bacterium]
SNYRPGSADKLGMDAATLRALNPRLIYAELTGFGPVDRRPAFDVVLQAETGFLHLTGEADQPPVKMPVALIDLLAAHQLKEGILLALLRRAESGTGSVVRTNLYAAALASLANQATNWLVAGFAPQRMGTAHPNIAPYGDLLLTSDNKYIVPAVGSDAQFKALCRVLHCSELAEQPDFATNAQRIIHRQALIEQLQSKVRNWTQADLMEVLLAAKVPAGALRSIPEVFAQPEAEKYLRRAKTETGREVTVVKQVVFELED